MFNLRKRISRKNFFISSLLLYAITVAIAFIVEFLPVDINSTFAPAYGIAIIIAVLVIVWRSIVLTRQRANDISGRHALAWMFLSVFLIGIFIGLFPSEAGENRYGLTQ